MRRRDVVAVVFAALIAALGSAGLARAQGSPGDALPAGHPPLEGDALPAGHPPLDDSNPHAHPGKPGSMPGVFEPPDDLEQPDPRLAPGTIVVDLRDPDDKPVAGETITLGVLINSIAKGDSRKHFQSTTDALGRAAFAGLDTASNVAYRVSSGYQGGSFAASPFQLGQARSMHVVLHVYPVVRSLDGALVVCEAVVAAELRDDRLQIEEALTFYNLGRTAWQPDDVRLALPEGYTAFNAQASMTDQGVDDSSGAGKLRGTFPPGKHAVQFRWQLPWSGDKDVDFDVGLPPHVAIARVMMRASPHVKLEVAGFPPSEVRRDDENQSFLVTERRLRPDDTHLASLAIGIHDLPTPGPGRLVATLLSTCSVGFGLVLAASGKRRRRGAAPRDSNAAREAVLEELAALEQARADGTIGPRTYERARRELMEALAQLVLADADAPPEAPAA